MIISASRRTDIPAFYTDWLMNRIKAGYVLVRNPFNAHQIRRISLLPQEVDAIIFWTRNPEKLMPHLPVLDSMGYRYYFQYTITGYPRLLEKSVPNPHKAIETFSRLSEQIGSGRVIWRYDPILLSNMVSVHEHERVFGKIASMLQGKTEKVVISFADLYKKTVRNLDAVVGLSYSDMLNDGDALAALARSMVNIATACGMEIQSCSEEIDLTCFGIKHGKCVDDDLLKKEFGISVPFAKDSGQREACGCVKSADIGQYNTCLHGCSYCYATFNSKTVLKNWNMHDPKSSFLIGSALDEEGLGQLENIAQQPLLF